MSHDLIRGKRVPQEDASTAEQSEVGGGSRIQFRATGPIPPVGRNVQAKQSNSPSDAAYDDTHQIAAHGVAGNGGALPHKDAIAASFGAEHAATLDGIQAHVGGEADTATKAIGAQAYATGNAVAFGDQPDLHTAAHEAAHVVQQKGGVQLKGGVGEVGDDYERNADAVADRVVQGKSAADLLGGFSRGSGSGQTQAPVQCYQNVGNSKRPWDRISDDGRMAVSDHERDAWATPDLIAQANKHLDANKSRAKIAREGGLEKVKTNGREHYLSKFKMVDRKAGFYDRNFGDDEVDLVDDCGGATQQNLGGENLHDRRFQGVTRAYGEVDEFTSPSTYKKDDNAPGGIVSTTEQMSGEIYVRIMKQELNKTLSRVDALKEWDKLDDARKDALAKKYGINKYAVPKMGQGITKGSERDMPGSSGNGYNFHFSLNLMTSGEDYVALEDFASSGLKYYFKMYGPPSKGQSFSEDEDNDTVDSKNTSMVVVHPHMLDGKIKTDAPLRDPRGQSLATLTKGTAVKIVLQGKAELKVEVLGGQHRGKTGWIYATQYQND